MEADNSTAFDAIPGSFRDPSGFLFRRGGVLYRQVNESYREHYEQLMASGLYRTLVDQEMLIPHQEVDEPGPDGKQAWRILRPEPVEFVSYPYEWSFSQLKDAALLTLYIQRIALDHDMGLKDTSTYNIQFYGGRPIFIDTLSFETYIEGRPWVAYRQFCQHFLAPLALMSKRDVRLGQLLRVHIDGIPLDLASALMPRRTWLIAGLAAHLHLHARAQKAFSKTGKELSKGTKRFSRLGRTGLIGIVQSLRSAVEKLHWKAAGTEWSDYYHATNYSAASLEDKKRLVSFYLDEAAPKSVWDLGANNGLFSRLASDRGIFTVAFDIDPAAVELNYRQVRKRGERRLLPLLLDLANPSPGLGWSGSERDSLFNRGPVDCVLALALIHHIAISNNVPFHQLAAFLAEICRRNLIIEFVPKSDSQVQRLLRSREDIFSDYDRASFERVFEKRFSIRKAETIAGTERTLYLMESR